MMKRYLQKNGRSLLLLFLTTLIITRMQAQSCDAVYPEATNLIPDPEMTDIANFSGWGPIAITNDPNQVYCGTSSGYVRGSCWPDGGSLNVVLNSTNGNALQPNTSYRVLAMIRNESAEDGEFHFQIEGYDEGASTFLSINKTSGWEQFDGSFKTGATVLDSDKGIYFNSCIDANGKTITSSVEDTCFIDNYQLVVVPDYEAGVYGVTLSSGYLDSPFSMETTSYTATIPYGTTSVTPTVSTIDLDATVTGADAVDVSSGSGSSTIVVTARNDSAQTSFTIDYAWATEASLKDLTVDAGSLSPAFNAGITEYLVYAPYGVTTVNLTATPADTAFNVTGDGALDISSGSGVASIVVSGEGVDTTIYTVTVKGILLKHAYTFETDTTDAVGGVHGTLHGNAQIIDGALVTSADGDYLSFDGAALDLSSYDAITMETYVVAGDGTNPGWSMLNYFGEGENNNAYWTTIATEDNNVRSFYSGTEVDRIGELEDGKYHHIVSILTKDSLSFFVDGELIGTTLRSGAFTIGTAHAYLAESGWPDPTWIGSILEFNIYNGIMDAASIATRSTLHDNDSDGIPNDKDNCPDVANANQADADGDGIGNVCDDDYNAATLSDLIVDQGKLMPAFDPNWYEYVVYAPFGVTEVTITATPADTAYTVTGDGVLDISSGKATTTVAASGDGLITSEYVVTVIGVKLEHAYTFDTDASDGVGSLDGSFVGTASVENGALVLDSNGDYIAFDGAALDLSSYDAITMEYYFRGSTTANTGWNWTGYFGGNDGNNSFRVSLGHWEDEMRLIGSGVEIFEPTINNNDGEYHQIVTVLYTDSLLLYKDGVRVAQVPIGKEIIIDPTYAYLGTGAWPDPTWQGSIYEFNIYQGIMDAAAVEARKNLVDYDADGIVNDEDEDDDNDGQLDKYELACGSDPIDSLSVSLDENANNIPDCQEDDDDGDGVADYLDNCPATANADQADMDGDGIGDVCDDDRDGDGVANDVDSCPDDVNIGDADVDGIDDACDELSATNTLVGELAFGEVSAGETVTKNLNIINTGLDALEVTSIVVPDGYTVDKTSLSVSGQSLSIVVVSFTPTETGDYNGKIAVVSNAGTDSIAVSGTGVGAILGLDPADYNIVFGPNPAEDNFMIDWSNSEIRNPSIQVISMDGKVIWKEQGILTNSVKIDLSTMAKGLFFVQLQSGGDTYMFKLLKK